MTLVLAWVPRNAKVQADVPVDHFAAGVAAPAGWQEWVEWRWRADPSDDWSAPVKQIVTPPDFSASYDPPADGWVQVTSYATQDGRRSWDTLVHEFYVIGGGVYTPGNRITDAGDNRITDAGDTRITE